MSEMRSVPQTGIERLLASLGQGTGTARGFLNENFGIPFVDTGFGLGDMMMGEGPELLNEMSWGKPLITGSGMASRMDPRIVDVGGIAGLFGGMGKNFAKAGIKDLFTQQPRKQAQGGYIVVDGPLFDQNRSQQAQLMERMGANEDEIFEKTKTYIDPVDKKPRQEVEHGREKYLTEEELEQEFTTVAERIATEGKNDKDLIKHNALFDLMMGEGKLKDRLINSPMREQDPEWFDNISLGDSGYLDSYRGSWREGVRDPTASGGWSRKPRMEIESQWHPDSSTGISDLEFLKQIDEIQGIVRHEGNHGIMSNAGVHGGGNTGTVPSALDEKSMYDLIIADEMIDDGPPLLSTIQSRNTAIENLDAVQKFTDEEEMAMYRNLSDEEQARLVQERWQMTQGEMDADPWFKKLSKNMIYRESALKDGNFDWDEFVKSVNRHLPPERQIKR